MNVYFRRVAMVLSLVTIVPLAGCKSSPKKAEAAAASTSSGSCPSCGQ